MSNPSQLNSLLNGNVSPFNLFWHGNEKNAVSEEVEIKKLLADTVKPLFVMTLDGKYFVVDNSDEITVHPGEYALKLIGMIPPVSADALGDPSFKATYGTRYACYAGAMANGISSEALVIAMGQAGMLGSFGAGGLLPERIEKAIQAIQSVLPNGPYAFNLLNSPNEPSLESRTVALYIQYQVPVIEASAYLGITENLVWYRASGLSATSDGKVIISHHIIAKLSRKEVAKRFLEPAPVDMLTKLVAEGKITQQQADLSRTIPMADDITVEADSGGHTDNRPLVNVLPAVIHMRDELQTKYRYTVPVRIGAAGGIGTPSAAIAAFAMGAAYIATGSINQACLESGASDHTRKLLAQAEMTDVAMAPASDMFEMGVKVQVLKRGTMFAMRAQKLYDLYSRYESWDEVPVAEREKLEKTVFKLTFEEIWQECLRFFTERDPKQIERANQNPKDRMALVFRWYLGLSSRWSNRGEVGREMDYQIWCGPAMGAFNDWVKDTPLADPANRRVAEVNLKLLNETALLTRYQVLRTLGLHLLP